MTGDKHWEQVEPIRVRIMSEAYDCADRGEIEAYNSIKVMCSEVLDIVTQLIESEREACARLCEEEKALRLAEMIRARGEK